MSFDVTGLNELVADMSKAPLQAQIKARGVVQKGCLNIKQDWQQRASGLRHAPAYPASITYETQERGNGNVEGVIGPDKDRPQGALGNLIEYGSVNSPPHGDGAAASLSEEPKFIKAMSDLAGEAL